MICNLGGRKKYTSEVQSIYLGGRKKGGEGMHEVSIICSAMEEIEHQCLINKITKVTTVVFAIGKFAAVDYNALKFAFESISRSTICEGAFLEMMEITPVAQCDLCHREYQVSFTKNSCPSCGNISCNIVRGNEILLYRIEGE